MLTGFRTMAKWPVLLLYLQGLLHLITGQQPPRGRLGPWRYRFQWENNGQVYSLMSTGSEYHAPVRPRSGSRVYVGRRDGTGHAVPGGALTAQVRTGPSEAHVGGQYMVANGRAPGARQQPALPYRQGAAGSPGARRYTPEYTYRINASTHDFSGSGAQRRGIALVAQNANSDAQPRVPTLSSRGSESLPGGDHRQARTEHSDSEHVGAQDRVAPGLVPVPSGNLANEAATNGEEMASDDPRNPFKNHRNSVFSNIYPPRGRTTARTRRPPPGTGYGTRYFHNGLPDLVPDAYAIQSGAYIQRVQMYALRCAAEENCLARSAYSPTVRDIDYRVLLRFPQKVKNQGTTDFLPVKPRHQWEWHSCHQHYHSMDAFSNYDLLEVATGQKVAEGHKASFCLEDTGCDAGVRRRYACTTHTQGLSPGCHDTYAANIDCQWIDITDVPTGNYVLKVTVNPNFHVQESDFSNNVVRCDIIYTGTQVQTRNCRVTRG